jgi:hypothetical protein
MKTNFSHIIYLLVVLLYSGMGLRAQQVQVNGRIDSSSILIGNQAHIHLIVAYDAKNGVPKIQWPQISDSIVSKIEVISKSKINSVTPDSMHPSVQQQTQDITISGFDSGYYAIPPFRFIVNGDTANPLLTEALMLQVMTVHVDTTKAFKDIKAPLQAPFTFLEVLPYIGYALLALLVFGALIYFIRNSLKKKKPVVIEQPKVFIPPHIKALEALEKLGLQKLWQEGKIKDYYTGITDILRVYLEERYDVGALEMTTAEIMFALKRKDLSESMKTKLREILVLADLVKFAKENPLPNEHELCLSDSIDFINETAERKEETPVETPPAPNPVQQTPIAT